MADINFVVNIETRMTRKVKIFKTKLKLPSRALQPENFLFHFI